MEVGTVGDSDGFFGVVEGTVEGAEGVAIFAVSLETSGGCSAEP